MQPVGAIVVEMAGRTQRPQVMWCIVAWILVEVSRSEDKALRFMEFQTPAQGDRPCAMFQPALPRLKAGAIAAGAAPARRLFYLSRNLGPLGRVARSIHRHINYLRKV
jgi:hypothetical protein